jgi:hypothetical protein
MANMKDRFQTHTKQRTRLYIYILFFVFLDIRRNCSRHSSKLIFCLISSCIQFWFIDAVPKYLKLVTFTYDLLATFLLWFCCIVRFVVGVKAIIAIFCPRPKCYATGVRHALLVNGTGPDRLPSVTDGHYSQPLLGYSCRTPNYVSFITLHSCYRASLHISF